MAGAAGTKTSTGRRLVIVESPAKAKTIAGYLGPGYVVEASVGHIRDLPNGAAEVPAKYKGEVLGAARRRRRHDFQPLYVVNRRQAGAGQEAQGRCSRTADELFLATDEDREGEAIAWHLLEVLKPKVPVKRMVFHEITKDAIQEAVGQPARARPDLVDAQETRRILDRLYGYEVSPVLWKKVMPRLSAGRVQSVATRLVVERERERIAFRSAEYWDLAATLATAARRAGRRALFRPPDRGRRQAGRPGPRLRLDGQLKGATARPPRRGDRPRAGRAPCADAAFAVRSVESKPYRRSPYAPFRTTTLQQEASRKLGFGATADHAGRPEAVRERLHHLHAYRLA